MTIHNIEEKDIVSEYTDLWKNRLIHNIYWFIFCVNFLTCFYTLIFAIIFVIFVKCQGLALNAETPYIRYLLLTGATHPHVFSPVNDRCGLFSTFNT